MRVKYIGKSKVDKHESKSIKQACRQIMLATQSRCVKIISLQKRCKYLSIYPFLVHFMKSLLTSFNSCSNSFYGIWCFRQFYAYFSWRYDWSNCSVNSQFIINGSCWIRRRGEWGGWYTSTRIGWAVNTYITTLIDYSAKA